MASVVIDTDVVSYLFKRDTDARAFQAIYNHCSFDRPAPLADALVAAGCTNEDILAHCRSGGQHVRGCWVVDLVLGKE